MQILNLIVRNKTLNSVPRNSLANLAYSVVIHHVGPYSMCVPSCRFTAWVDELLRVLKDLQVGRYQRTMVSSKPAEEQDNGVCGLPPMQHKYIVCTKCLVLACSSGVSSLMAHFQLRTCVVYGTMGASHYDNQIMVHVISVEMHAHTTWRRETQAVTLLVLGRRKAIPSVDLLVYAYMQCGCEEASSDPCQAVLLFFFPT